MKPSGILMRKPFSPERFHEWWRRKAGHSININEIKKRKKENKAASFFRRADDGHVCLSAAAASSMGITVTPGRETPPQRLHWHPRALTNQCLWEEGAVAPLAVIVSFWFSANVQFGERARLSVEQTRGNPSAWQLCQTAPWAGFTFKVYN